MDADTIDLLEGLLSCFVVRFDDDWYWHKDNDAEWHRASEDLQENLTQMKMAIVRATNKLGW